MSALSERVNKIIADAIEAEWNNGLSDLVLKEMNGYDKFVLSLKSWFSRNDFEEALKKASLRVLEKLALEQAETVFKSVYEVIALDKQAKDLKKRLKARGLAVPDGLPKSVKHYFEDKE